MVGLILPIIKIPTLRQGSRSRCGRFSKPRNFGRLFESPVLPRMARLDEAERVLSSRFASFSPKHEEQKRACAVSVMLHASTSVLQQARRLQETAGSTCSGENSDDHCSRAEKHGRAESYGAFTTTPRDLWESEEKNHISLVLE